MQHSPTTGQEDRDVHRVGPWQQQSPSTPAPAVLQRNLVPRTALVATAAIALALATISAVALVFDHNISRTLSTTRASLAITTSNLASTKSSLATTRTNLASTHADLSQTLTALNREKGDVRSLSSEVATMQALLANSQSSLHASQQIDNQVTTVANSLKQCVNDTGIFEAGFSAELSGGYFSPVVTEEATQADAACNQANSDYNALESELPVAGATIA
jgi:septal ring factor EnvC (AmiA/AmiB activator)